MRARVRAVVFVVATIAASGCLPFTTTPSPTPSASPTPARPRFELSTYQYALQTKGKIRVAVRDNAPPMSARSAATPEGFEPDVAREIARAIWGASEDPESHIEWVSVDDSTRVSALTSDRADITLAGLLITDDVKKVIDLSDTYLHTGPRLLVKKTNDQIKEIADVATGEQTVCAVKASRPEQELKKITNGGAKVLELENLGFCMQALATGAADAIAADETTLLGLVWRQPNDLKLVGTLFADDRLGIGVKKSASGDRTGFLEFVNSALLKVVADRTWAKIYEKDIAPLSGEKKQLPTD
ncbi:MAG TPA: transporter substrate-binding domain-containing protein [Candidatus Limnocylindria bacterium]|nr:transporter substrate-binding domain-containing protein [Candidatus Limnocylindria bacterium]